MISTQSSIYSDLDLNQEDLENIDAAAERVEHANAQVAEMLVDAETWQFSDDEDFSAVPRVATRRSKPGFERLRVVNVQEDRFDNNRLQKVGDLETNLEQIADL